VTTLILKNKFSVSIKELRPNRTRNRLYFKIRKLRQTFILAVDEKIKIFPLFSKKREETEKGYQTQVEHSKKNLKKGS